MRRKLLNSISTITVGRIYIMATGLGQDKGPDSQWPSSIKQYQWMSMRNIIATGWFQLEEEYDQHANEEYICAKQE